MRHNQVGLRRVVGLHNPEAPRIPAAEEGVRHIQVAEEVRHTVDEVVGHRMVLAEAAHTHRNSEQVVLDMAVVPDLGKAVGRVEGVDPVNMAAVVLVGDIVDALEAEEHIDHAVVVDIDLGLVEDTAVVDIGLQLEVDIVAEADSIVVVHVLFYDIVQSPE